MALRRPTGVTGRGGGRPRRCVLHRHASRVIHRQESQATFLNVRPPASKIPRTFPGARPRSLPPTRARGVPGAARGPGSPAAAACPSRRTGRSRASLQNPRPGRRARVPGNEGGGSRPHLHAGRPPAGVPTPAGRESPGSRRAPPSRASRLGLAHPPALVGWSRGSLAGPGYSSSRTAGRSGWSQPGVALRFGFPSQGRAGWAWVPSREGLDCHSRRVRSRGGTRAPPFRSPVPPSREGQVLLAGGARTHARSSLPGAPAAADRSTSQECARARAGPCA
ncbi:hypothetical protein NDU88_003756 [Pleurodeles waltl]|uniref:Uncharacterized protein n=1 Tax=Pleurodeles waltl TaxID=8319 RepID=A0AAV7W320_PLEWA|nr:hypothetical protein NDU88_003756 [Pleurodeles waltl]